VKLLQLNYWIGLFIYLIDKRIIKYYWLCIEISNEDCYIILDYIILTIDVSKRELKINKVVKVSKLVVNNWIMDSIIINNSYLILYKRE